jgi:zinc transport system substrate-binding protein
MFHFKLVFFFLLPLLSFFSTAHAYRVVTTIPPLASLVRSIAGEEVSIETLVDNGVSPHTYALKPSDLYKLSSADVIFWIGPSYESFLTKLLKNYLSKAVTFIEVSKVRLYPLQENADHSHHGHSHLKECSGCNIDGHIWLDPDNGFYMAEAIASHFIKTHPSQRRKYEQRLSLLRKNLEKIKKEIKDALGGYENKSFLTLHDGYQYFEKAFNLKKGKPIYLIPDIALSANKILTLRSLIKTENIQCIFAETQFPQGLIETLAEGSKIRVGVLDPLGTSKIPYETLLISLMKSFSNCLKD